MLGWSAMPELMFERRAGKYDFEQTVAAIQEKAEQEQILEDIVDE